MLQDQKPQHNFGWSLTAPPRSALQTSLRLRFKYPFHQLLVVQNPIGRTHPWLPQIVHFLGQDSSP
jgi:hypothetical protein